MRIFFLLILIVFVDLSLMGQSPKDELLTIVETELQREMSEFSKAAQPPYFLAYRVHDIYSGSITSSFGSLVGRHTNRSRIMVTDIKVGDYSFDNSHPIESYDNVDIPRYGLGGDQAVELPTDNRPEAIRFMVWQQTQASYRQALSMYKSVKNIQKPTDTPVPDFSKETPSVHIDGPLPEFSNFFSEQEWTPRIKKFSTPFLSNPDIIDAEASLEVGLERKYLISSEGTRIAQNRTYAYLTIQGSIRAEDGDVVPLHLSYFTFNPAQLPSDEKILQDVNQMIATLIRLRTAPVAEPYTGPAILHARTAGVFFHEIFGHRVEGHRLKDKSDGQTFKGKLKEQVLPASMSVVFDPTLPNFNGQDLNGYYQYDDEGVRGQKVKVVENGVLKTFLMSRTPIESLSNSNGHGRAEAGTEAVSRQSNLIIENQKPVSTNDLRNMLIAECKQQNKPYGYLFMDVVGGFTTTGRYMPNAFNIFPTEVYRVYADGRPDELVRGVDLIGTPLAMFAEIKAADDKREVFTGFCGAESGSVPVTAISPSLFVKRIETQKKPVTQVDKNILQRPTDQ
jgi:TldD protein